MSSSSIPPPPAVTLPPPKDDPFTQAQLKEFNGSDADKPIYVAIKGALVLFDIISGRSKIRMY